MLVNHRNLALAALALALSACAAPPESIKPFNISAAPYVRLTCAQLASYKVTLTNAYNDAADSENTARNLDAASFFALGFPVGTMTHESVPYQISDLKGRIVAVEKVETADRCPQGAS
jgi:hypothetical protein